MLVAGGGGGRTSDFVRTSFHTCKKLFPCPHALLWQSVGSLVCTGPVALKREREFG